MLNNKISLYIPQQLDNSNKVINLASKELSQYFGGVTASLNNKGLWLDNGKLVKDNITILNSFSNNKAFKQNLKNVFKLAEYIKKELKQDSITLEVNNKMRFI